MLRYAGRTQAGFRMRFPDDRTLYLVPSGTSLRVTTKAAAPKIFAWEYEGPVNGVGTACTVCVADAATATWLLRQHYLR